MIYYMMHCTYLYVISRTHRHPHRIPLTINGNSDTRRSLRELWRLRAPEQCTMDDDAASAESDRSGNPHEPSEKSTDEDACVPACVPPWKAARPKPKAGNRPRGPKLWGSMPHHRPETAPASQRATQSPSTQPKARPRRGAEPDPLIL